jgi:hypothetical protein
MLERREFMGLAAGGVAAAALPRGAAAQDAVLPDWTKVPTRTAAKAEILYKTPHGKPNGMALTRNPGEVWIVDQATGGWVSLIRLADGSLIREFQADLVGASGATMDEDDTVMWITSTHNSLIVKVDPRNGRTIAKYETPGSGRKYARRGDVPARSSRLPLAYPQLARGSGGMDDPPLREGLTRGQLPNNTREWVTGRTGAEGILVKDNLLIFAVANARAIFVVDKTSWEVQAAWPTPGNRNHGLTWANAARTGFWNNDANMGAFFRYDLATGAIVEKVQLQDDPPTVAHEIKLIGDHMYFCDDTGWMLRTRWN